MMKQAAGGYKLSPFVNVLLNVACSIAAVLWDNATVIGYFNAGYCLALTSHYLHHIDIASAGEYVIWAEGFFIDIFNFTDATGH